MRIALLLMVIVTLQGCTALHTSISKGKLDVQTRMSQTIYLDPVEPEQRTVFLDIRQTAPEYQQPLMKDVANLLTERGYRLVSSPSAAQYWLQVNIRTVLNLPPAKVLQAEYHMSEQQIVELLHPGMAPPEPRPMVQSRQERERNTMPAIIYADSAVGKDIDGRDIVKALAVVAVIAGAEYVGNQLVKDQYYTLVADLQVAERLAPDSVNAVHETAQQVLLQGDSGILEQLWENSTDRRKYQVKLIGFANKANLSWAEAELPLHQGVLRSLAGIF